MFNEKAFIAQVEAADTKELAELLRQPTREEEEALRTHLGAERYQRMHSMALRRRVSRSMAHSRGQSPERGNVVVIHGIMGGELTATDRKGSSDQIWVKALKIMTGWLGKLRLGEDGRAEYDERYDVRASGIMKRYYGELLLSLSENWQVRAFWFDWRKDLRLAASDLEAQMDGWFKDGEPVHLVAHSMGGLVARTFIKKYPERWKGMWDEKENGRRGGRLIMLGTPNYGSFAIPQTITGIESMVRKLSLLDVRHSRSELLDILNSFVGSYQMLPSPSVMPEMQPLYNAGTYTGANVSQRHLDTALAHHEYLSDVVDESRMIYVAGYGQPTFSNIRDFKKIGSVDAYDVTMDGDGRVPHALGLLRRNGRPVGTTYYIRDDHGNLSSNARILDALTELLETGKTSRLETQPAASRGAQKRSAKSLREEALRRTSEEERQLEISLRRMRLGRASLASRSGDARLGPSGEIGEEASITRVSPEERKVEETLTLGYLSRGSDSANAQASLTYSSDGSGPDGAQAKGAAWSDLSIESTRIEIGLVHGGIESVDYDNIRAAEGFPVDAIAVGHYIGVQPQAAELQLDRAISAALPGKAYSGEIAKADLILTQYTERGIIHGKLGQPFFMPDPRANSTGRLIAIAGMDEPGRFGVPELTVLFRELCWSLGRLGKRHLATVMIGAGVGNLSLTDAVSALINGVRRAVTGSHDDDQRLLRRITIVEFDPRKIPTIQDVILREQERQRKHGLEIVYEQLSAAQMSAIERAAIETAKRELERQLKSWQSKQSELENAVPSRVTLNLDMMRKAYRFGAITETASVPEREIRIDPVVVMQANDELAGEQNPGMQLERGRFLEELLMPDDLRRQLYNNAPVVMMLDATTARIHWEMVAQPELIAATGGVAVAHEADEFKADRFLGTSRGFTRQLRTTFAPPPEPPPPPRRVLRVLVVADPAEDAHLPGAQEEGEAVADLFESYNTIYDDRLENTRVEVVRLFGPVEATRTNVLRELMVRQYDLLHYAGHCEYDKKDPSSSGWIFNMGRKERLSANELNRIDRIPKFVFSNACESGITPDRSRERSAELAPSFAEAFFMRGVANFVCTAWPVDDLAARIFSLTLYGWLLGIKVEEDGSYSRGEPKPMHYAMREARIQIANMEEGVATWGAYQHYGNPYFQLFNAPQGKAGDDGQEKKSTRKKTARGSKKAVGSKARKPSARKSRK
ncbi:MAG TPA: CHAT domain-containing protein [Pyrinomonadaceae bacterium]|nr:CHAT domain-containing protein [Pyrinomonadaceae bacterium]